MSEKPSIDSIFCSAIEIESSVERESYIERSCGEDLELKRQVERLLRAHFHGGSILDSPAQGIDATLDEPITERPGTVIGRYKLLEQIGEGGFGVVFMAEQQEPVRRKVALKIIKPGMDTKEVIARFDAERQALAIMDHPNIAKVLDAGATESGRPYFVMELVRGVPITHFCDQNSLITRERLELFGSVCQAVQHAHQKGRTARVDVTLRSEAIEVDEVIVTAEAQEAAMLKRSTRSVSILATEDLLSVRGQNLGSLLSRLPGVSTMSTGPSIAKPVVRGLHSQRIVVLNAGVPQEGQQWGGEHAPEIDPFSLSRVEVVKGAAGVEYGVGAIGGVVRIEPEDLPEEAGVGGSVVVEGYSNNRQAAGSVMLEGSPSAVPGFGWRVRTSARRAGDSRTSDHVIGNSGFSELDFSGSVGHDEGVGLHAHASRFSTTLGLFRGAHIGNVADLLRAIERGEPAVDYDFSYDVEAPKQRIVHDLLTVEGHVRTGGGDWLEAQYGFQSNRREEFDAHGRFGEPSSDPAFALTLRTHTLDLKLRQRPRRRLLGVLGIHLMNQSNRNAESGQLIPNFRALTGGAYVRQSWLSGPWTVEGGIRFDVRSLRAWPRERLSSGDFVRRSRFWSSLSVVVGSIRQIGDHWSVAANVATAWRPPSVNELYNFGVHHGTAQFEAGNPELSGERSYTFDATLRHVSDRSALEVGVFANRMSGYIFLLPEPDPRVTIRGSFPSFTYRQTDARLWGFDGAYDLSLDGRTRVHTSLSMVRGTSLDADEPLISMPSDRAMAGIDRGFEVGKRIRDLTLGADVTVVRRQDRFPEGVDYADPPDGYVLVGASFGMRILTRFAPVSVSLSARNLMNASYRDYLSRFRYFIDDPGRTLILRISMPFGMRNAT